MGALLRSREDLSSSGITATVHGGHEYSFLNDETRATLDASDGWRIGLVANGYESSRRFMPGPHKTSSRVSSRLHLSTRTGMRVQDALCQGHTRQAVVCPHAYICQRERSNFKYNNVLSAAMALIVH